MLWQDMERISEKGKTDGGKRGLSVNIKKTDKQITTRSTEKLIWK